MVSETKYLLKELSDKTEFLQEEVQATETQKSSISLPTLLWKPELVWEQPSRFTLKEDGSFLFPQNLDQVEIRDYLTQNLPKLPFEFLDPQLHSERNYSNKLRYKIVALAWALPYLKNDVLEVLESISSDTEQIEADQKYMEYINNLYQLGDEVRLLFEVIDRQLVLLSITASQWKAYDLSLFETQDIESVSNLRSEINKRQSSYESSAVYFSDTPVVRLSKIESFEIERLKVTSKLYRILHLGADSIPTKTKFFLRKECSGEKSIYRSKLETKILEFRLSELDRYRKNPDGYFLPVFPGTLPSKV